MVLRVKARAIAPVGLGSIPGCVVMNLKGGGSSGLSRFVFGLDGWVILATNVGVTEKVAACDTPKWARREHWCDSLFVSFKINLRVRSKEILFSRLCSRRLMQLSCQAKKNAKHVAGWFKRISNVHFNKIYKFNTGCSVPVHFQKVSSTLFQ